MPYPGVPKEKEPKMERCVTKVMKTGKSKSSAIAICKTSIMSQIEPEKKEEPYRVVENSDNHYVFNSNSKIDASEAGTLVKGIEIFKAGIFKGIEFKTSALDKMVANFHYLKAHNIFPYVPMRADHPGWGAGEVDKIGGYISDLVRVGKKLLADVRFTNDGMLEKVKSGQYINRSAEIGAYRDNEGVTYNPILYGFAWVDIPAVEGLSPKFSFSKEKVNLINLNSNMAEEQFPPKEEEKNEEEIAAEEAEAAKLAAEAKKAEEEVEAKNKENEKAELSKNIEVTEFSKAFPKEFAELEAAKEELKKAYESRLENFVNELVKEGKITPASKESELKFVKSLSSEQFDQYETIKKESPAIVKFDDEQNEEGDDGQKKEGSNPEPTAEEKADKFLKEVK